MRGVKATKQSLVRKRLKIASLSLAMVITYADTLMKRYTSQIGMCCRYIEHIMNTSTEIQNKYGCLVNGFVADLTNPIDIKNMIQAVIESTKRIDILVINNGTPNPRSFSKCDIQDWLEGINICLKSTIYLCQETLPIMKKNGFGIIMTSIFAKEPDPNFVISSVLRLSP